MRKVLAGLLLICMTWPVMARGDELEVFSRGISYFYLHPSPESFALLQKDAERFRPQLAGSAAHGDVLLAVMIATISRIHGWPILDGETGRQARTILSGDSKLAHYIADDAQVEPTKLDIWWVQFFASGDEQFLDRIFQFAGLKPPQDNMGRATLIGAASWSFKANCRQHQKVLDYARRRLMSGALEQAQLTYLKEFVAVPEAAGADSSTAEGTEGRPLSNSESEKSTNEFSGKLIAVTDEDWREKWNTSAETTPRFHQARAVPYGKKVFMLIFFSNPKGDDAGNSNVLCDLTMTNPKGDVTLNQKDAPCFKGRLAGNAHNIYLAAPVVQFMAAPDDPAGTWVMEVTLRDVNRNVRVPLLTRFELSTVAAAQ